MADLHVTVTFTFRTPQKAPIVLENVLAAINRSATPYDVSSAACDSFDLDEVED